MDLTPSEMEFLAGPNCCGLPGDPSLYVAAFEPARIFKAVRDGWNADVFHQKVDNHSPTLVVYKTSDE